MDMKKIEELTGFREPNEREIQLISRYFQNVFQGEIKVCKNASIILFIFSILIMCSCIINGLSAIVIGLLVFVLAFSASQEKKGYLKKIQVFNSGKFQVLDGEVIEIFTSVDYPGASNVRFQSVRGETLKMMFTVRQEGLQIGTPLLLAYADESVIKRGESRAFTPYMLTEEGLRHWI